MASADSAPSDELSTGVPSTPTPTSVPSTQKISAAVTVT